MRAALSIALISALSGLSACGGTEEGVSRLTDPNRLTYVEIPDDWNVYEIQELSSVDGLGYLADYRGLTLPVESAHAFDSAPVALATNAGISLTTADFPVGASVIRRIPTAERDFVSRDVITQSILPYKGFDRVAEVVKEDFTFGPGVDGVRTLVSFEESGVGVGVAYLIAVTDAVDGRLFGVYVGCDRDCFEANQAEIERVVDSWLVSTKD